MSSESGYTGNGSVRDPVIRQTEASKDFSSVFSGLLALLDTMLKEPDPDFLVEQVAQAVQEILGADAVFFLYLEDSEYLRTLHYEGELKRGYWDDRKIDVSRSFAGAVAKAGTLLYTEDVRKEPYYDPDLHNIERSRSFCGVPIFLEGKTHGVLFALWRHARQVTPIEQALLILAGERISENLKTIENIKDERRRNELNMILGELTILVNNPILDQKQADEAIKQFFEKIGDTLNAKLVLMYLTPLQDGAGLPLHIYFSNVVEPFVAPFDLFKKFINSSEDILEEPLSANEAIARWAKENLDIDHGYLISNRPVFDSIGCLLCGRSEGEPQFTEDEIHFLKRTGDVITSAESSRAQRTYEGRIAKSLQGALLNTLPSVEGFTLEGIGRSATSHSEVGGDFYEVFETPGDRLVIMLGDISGKGIDVASLSYLIKNYMGSYLTQHAASASDAVEALNELIVSAPHIHNFASLILLTVDKKTGVGSYCCAGHPPACLYRATGELQTLDARSPLVGALEAIEFSEEAIRLDHGDVLFFYTDGATEARSPDHEFFGEDRVIDLFASEIQKGFDSIVDRILADIETFTGGKITDDIALLAVRYD